MTTLINLDRVSDMRRSWRDAWTLDDGGTHTLDTDHATCCVWEQYGDVFWQCRAKSYTSHNPIIPTHAADSIELAKSAAETSALMAAVRAEIQEPRT